jgi:phospholipase/lecithinase/hemolysin
LVDNEAYINTFHITPALLGTGGNVTTAACSTASAQNCNTTTLSAGVTTSTYTLYLYADDRHFGPNAHRLMGDNAYSKIKARW